MGGRAMKRAGVQRIRRNDIPETIRYVSKISNIPTKHLHKIGSVGKVSTSGDIDLAIDVNEFDPNDVHKHMISVLGLDKCTYNKGTKVASYAIPIKGNEDKGLVQVDFMYTTSVDWAKFAYHSEGEGSKYKGSIRTILLMAVAANLQEPGTDHFEYEKDGTLTIRAGRTLDLGQGLRRIFQTRPQRKDGKGYLKSMKSIEIDKFKEMYPTIEVKGGQITVDNPQKVLKVLFGGSVKPDDVRTAEQIIQLIQRKFDEETQQSIFDKAKERAKGLVGKTRLPKELIDETK